MTHPAEAAGIAERLTKAQREALLHLHDQDGRCMPSIAEMHEHLASLGHPMQALPSDLARQGRGGDTDPYFLGNGVFYITPLGLAVAHILRQEGK